MVWPRSYLLFFLSFFLFPNPCINISNFACTRSHSSLPWPLKVPIIPHLPCTACVPLNSLGRAKTLSQVFLLLWAFSSLASWSCAQPHTFVGFLNVPWLYTHCLASQHRLTPGYSFGMSFDVGLSLYLYPLLVFGTWSP